VGVGDELRSRSFKPLVRRAGLPDIPFHALRHSFATLMLAGGEHPKVVQEMMGHFGIRVTMDFYSHVLPDMQKEAVDRLGAVLSQHVGVLIGVEGLGTEPRSSVFVRFCRAFLSGGTRIRTGDTMIFSHVLYQLSYPAGA